MSRVACFGLLVATAFPARAQEPPPEGGGPPPVEEPGEGAQGDEEVEAEGDAPQVSDGAIDPASVASAAPAPEAPAPSSPPVVWPLTVDDIDAHLRQLALRHPQLVELRSIGRSAGGREILVLHLGVRELAPEVRRAAPVLLLLDFQGRASAGAEALIALGWRLCTAFERDEPGVRALLTHAEVALAPALDPDVRALESPKRSTLFERNFPSGWQPESVRAGSGRVSLSLSESLATVRYLAELSSCAVVLGFTPPLPRGSPYPEAELPTGDREVFAKLAAALELAATPPMIPWHEVGSGGGGLFDYAYQARGIYPLLFTLPLEEELAAGGLASFVEQVNARVLRCLPLLPRLTLVQEGLERVASDTWQLDVRIHNSGIVPTASALGRHREPLADVALQLHGAKLVATAKRPAGGAEFTDASFQVRTPLSGGTLAGGEERWLRLFFEAAAGSGVRVTAHSAWAGAVSVDVALP